jgi:hypothetical protein
MSWWKHAFAVEPAGPATPTPEQQQVIDAWCRRIIERGLTLPAILFLESSRPLGPLAAQSMLFLQPWFELVLDRRQLQLLTAFLERRGSFDYLCSRLEELSANSGSAPAPQQEPAGRKSSEESLTAGSAK